MSKVTWSGNEVDVFFDDLKVPLVQTVSGDDAYNHEPASGVGDIHVQENVPTRAMHTITVDAMLFKKSDLIARGIIYENGDAALQGKTFSITIQSKKGRVMKAWDDCKCDRARVTVRAHAVLVQDATFLALDTSGVLVE